MKRAFLPALAFGLAVAGCSADTSAPAAAALPAVRVVSVAPNTTNVLALTLTVASSGADSVHVQFHAVSQSGDSVTPAHVAADSMDVAVFGLLPATSYSLRAVATGTGGTTVSDSVVFTTGSLPSDLPVYSASGTAPSPGYVVFSGGRYGIVIDNSGRVVWYHAFAPLGPGLNFIAQSNGRYAAQPNAPAGMTPVWNEVDPAGTVTRTFSCTGGLVPRFHDLIREDDDSYWMICDDVRTLDLSALGGNAAARVTAAELQHIAADGSLRFRWNAFEHLDIGDLDSAARSGPTVNWTHANAIVLRADGLLLASFRNLNEITAINTQTGAVAWHLGGRHDDFGLATCCEPTFARQHGLRVSDAGVLMFLDNSGTPGDSRVEQYTLDASTHHAQMSAAFSAVPHATATIGGSVQQLPNGHLLASFGDGHRVEEFDAAGHVVWQLNGDPGYVFRAQRITSLYTPGVGTPR